MKKLVATLFVLLFTAGASAVAGSAIPILGPGSMYHPVAEKKDKMFRCGMPNPLSSEQWAIANAIEDEAEREAYIQKCIETNPWMIKYRSV